MINISGEICRENQNSRFMSSKVFFPENSCRLWDNMGGKKTWYS